jgi:thiosulfate/3-mercaptopyruvate sulfurtransferase
MSKKIMKKNIMLRVALFSVIAVGLLAVGGCGTSGYDTPNYNPPAPVLTQTSNGLIDVATLMRWQSQGLVNAPSGEKVVILDVTSQTTYDAGHIPGAVRVDSGTEMMQTRFEGVAEMASLVADGAHMDEIIKRAGIDANTTIVCTSNSLTSATRLYTTFRYWGFPKNRLKVLDGVDGDWMATYTAEVTTPTITPSSYSVTPNGANRVQADLRASLGEMMDAVRNYDGTKQVIIDTLHAVGYAGTPGTTTGLFPAADSTIKEYVVFEGLMNNAVILPQSTLYAGNKFFPADDGTAASLKSKFTAVGMDATKIAYVHCRAGNAATIEFFALDGILNWNAVWYDGSWGQWGQMADIKGGKLKVGSIWSTYPLSTSVNYNIDSGFTIQPLHYTEASDTFTSVTDPDANQVESTDKAYISPGSASSSSSSSSGGGSSSGGSGGGC